MSQKTENDRCCENPDRLRNKPEECTPDQIRECHGEEGDRHPCCEAEPEGTQER